MADAKSESYSTSVGPSSPQSPKHTEIYYDVRSPTVSHNNDKSSHSLTTPYQTPTNSPSHHSSSFEYSAIGTYRFSRLARKGNQNMCREGSNIDIAEDHMENVDNLTSCRCHCLITLFGLVSIFFLFCSIIWTASMTLKPQIIVKSLTVHNFYLGQGSDNLGVQTRMITINSTLNLFIHNPATFFGIHLNVHPLHLFYSEIVVATGQLEGYFQPRKTRGLVSMRLEGENVPLYGAGEDLSFSRSNNVKVPIKLELDVHSLGHVIGKLVKTQHKLSISCSLSIDPNSNITTINFRQHSCTNR